MKTITTRLDDEAEIALSNLVTQSGVDQSKLLRSLIINAERERVRAQLRAESESLRNDPEYLAELAAINEIMEPLSAW